MPWTLSSRALCLSDQIPNGHWSLSLLLYLLSNLREPPVHLSSCLLNPEYSLEGLKLKLKLQYFGHLMQTANSLEKTLMLGKTEGRRGQQRIRWLDGITDSIDMNLGRLWEMVRDREAYTTCRLNDNNSKELGMTERLTLTYLVSERVGTTSIYQKWSGSMSVPSASPILLYKS